ncbi:12908_t:CDS:2, partial [Funneliformis geosporum]
NMATLPDVLNSIAPLLAQIPQYVGQELPDDYYNKVMHAINYGHSLGVVGFDDVIKTNILAVKLGSAQAYMRALMSDKFLSIDTPETYEK